MESLLIWGQSNKVKHQVVLRKIQGVEKSFELNRGISRLNNWPETAQLEMDPDLPHNTVLTDTLSNINNLIIASEKLTHFLSKQNIDQIEILPIDIINHKGRPISEKYFIVNPLSPIDCLDVKKSSAEFSEIVKTNISHVARVVLDPGKLEKNRILFRLAKFFKPILIQKILAEKIQSENFTGIRWVELDKYSN